MNLAVMMAAYNANEHIESALGSLLNQQGFDALDVIVVDDGSTDNTADLVARMAEENPQIRLIRTPNQGVACARNEGLRALKKGTDVVSFLDADDLVPEGRFARDLGFFRADPALDMTYGFTTMFREANADQTGPAPNSPTASGRAIQLASATYRASTLLAIGDFDENFHQAEDMDYLLRFFERMPRYRVQEETCLYYRRHDNNMTHERDQLRRDVSRALLLSIRRRRSGNLPPYPADLFDAKGFTEAHGW